MTKSVVTPRGGGYLSIVRGTGTCHFLGVLFSNRDGIMGIVFTIFRHFTELWVQGIFDNFRNYGPRYSFDLWNCGPKIHQNLRNYRYQFFGQNGTSPSHKRLSYPPPPPPRVTPRMILTVKSLINIFSP